MEDVVGVCWIICTDARVFNDGEVVELTTGGISTSQLGQLLLWLRRQLAKWRMGPPYWPKLGVAVEDAKVARSLQGAQQQISLF